MTPLRGVGLLALVGGLVLVFAPDLLFAPDPDADLFETIERRVRPGLAVGVGAFLIARTKLRPWSVTVATLVFWGTAGFLFARLVGLALDGTDSRRQWLWVGVEVAILLAAAAFLWWKGRRMAAAG